MKKAVIVSSVRTPVGKCRGALAEVEAHKLAAVVIEEAIRRARIDPAEAEDVIFGNLFANDVANLSRMAALEAGVPIEVPAYTLDRQCASSLNALVNAALAIESGHAKIIVAGGVESDSRRPYVVEKPSAAYQAVMPKVWDLRFRLAPEHIGDPTMIVTAENLAKQYGLTRRDADAFAMESHRKAAAAWNENRFADQIVPVTVKTRRGETRVDRDETYREDISLEVLGKLRPIVSEGIVTAGNASPMSDGAGAMVVMEKELAVSRGLEILAEFKDFAAAGVDPNIMGIGPVYSTRKLLRKNGLTPDDIDLTELNEAFAAQAICCVKELGIAPEKLNVNGGAIALGHPLAGTGAVLTAKMVYEMRRRDAKLGLIAFCIGGGQGLSVLLERP